MSADRAPAIQRPGAFRRGAAHVLLAAIDVVLLTCAFAGWELWLRNDPSAIAQGLDMRGIFENDGTGSIRTVPHFHASVAVEGRFVQISLNGLGLRGPEVPPREPQEKRILALGDSHVFGQGVDAEDTFVFQLAPLLERAAKARVTPGNGGMPANGTAELLRDLKRYKSTFGPDVTILGVHLGTDFLDDVFGRREIVEGYALSTDAARFIKNSWRGRMALRSRAWFDLELAISQFAERTGWHSLSMGRPEPDESERARTQDFPPPGLRDEGLFMDARNETPQIHRILDRTESALRAIRDEAAPGKIVVLLIPTWISVFPGAFEKRMREMKDLARNSNVPFDPQDYEVGTCARRLAERCREKLGVGVVDLTPQLMGRVDLYLPHDRHLAPAGHAFVARLLEPVVAPLLTGER